LQTEAVLSQHGAEDVKAVGVKGKTSHNEKHDSDSVLVQRALHGDADAFSTLFQVHKGRVYAVCLRMTNNTADADDLTQEAFIQAFRKLATFRGESSLSTWLHRVAVNTALMHFRRQSTPHASLDQPAGGESSSKREIGQHDHHLICSLDRIALGRALKALPLGYRTIFELHEIGGYGHREIAKILRCSVGNSKSQLHKAKQRIRECLVSRRQLARNMERTLKDHVAGRNTPIAESVFIEKDSRSLPQARLAVEHNGMQSPSHNAPATLALASSIQGLAETTV
jgi:RNA polymerase sigma-70 factor (ECF subfamily)